MTFVQLFAPVRRVIRYTLRWLRFTASAREHSTPVREHSAPVREHSPPVREHATPVREQSTPVREHAPPASERLPCPAPLGASEDDSPHSHAVNLIQWLVFHELTNGISHRRIVQQYDNMCREYEWEGYHWNLVARQLTRMTTKKKVYKEFMDPIYDRTRMRRVYPINKNIDVITLLYSTDHKAIQTREVELKDRVPRNWR